LHRFWLRYRLQQPHGRVDPLLHPFASITILAPSFSRTHGPHPALHTRRRDADRGRDELVMTEIHDKQGTNWRPELSRGILWLVVAKVAPRTVVDDRTPSPPEEVKAERRLEASEAIKRSAARNAAVLLELAKR